jgi:hypothetical protein
MSIISAHPRWKLIGENCIAQIMILFIYMMGFFIKHIVGIIVKAKNGVVFV